MENIDSKLLHDFYFKDGYYFFVPDRLLVDEANDLLEKLELGDEKVDNEN